MRSAATHEDLLEQLAEVGRLAVERGLALASGGNLSARLPGEDQFIVTGAGTWLDRLTPDNFSVMNLAGAVVSGATRPSSEWKLHQRTYQKCPGINCVIHLHPQHTVLLDALGHQIRLITLDHAYYVRSVGTVPYYPTGSDALAENISMAFRRILNLEEAATATYRALVLGDKNTMFPPESFEALHHA